MRWRRPTAVSPRSIFHRKAGTTSRRCYATPDRANAPYVRGDAGVGIDVDASHPAGGVVQPREIQMPAMLNVGVMGLGAICETQKLQL